VDRGTTDSAAQDESRAPRTRWDASSLLALVNGVLAGIGSVYVTTRSVPITVVAGSAALLLAGLIVIVKR
jgi:hypothetical protein